MGVSQPMIVTARFHQGLERKVKGGLVEGHRSFCGLRGTNGLSRVLPMRESRSTVLFPLAHKLEPLKCAITIERACSLHSCPLSCFAQTLDTGKEYVQ